eukprot:Gb_21930 [translate_table: standard]
MIGLDGRFNVILVNSYRDSHQHMLRSLYNNSIQF